MTTKRYATLCYPGLLFPETETIAVGKQATPEELFRQFGPRGGYRISFHARVEERKDGELLTGRPKAEGKEFVHGRPFTLAEMRAMRPALDRILLSNVECNRWKGAIRCPPGNWQPWDDDVVVVAPVDGGKGPEEDP